MNKLLIYKILLTANITISVLLVTFLIVFKPSGKTLILTILMTFIGLLGALAMYREIRRNPKTDN
jgi:hypothetical protein